MRTYAKKKKKKKKEKEKEVLKSSLESSFLGFAYVEWQCRYFPEGAVTFYFLSRAGLTLGASSHIASSSCFLCYVSNSTRLSHMKPALVQDALVLVMTFQLVNFFQVSLDYAGFIGLVFFDDNPEGLCRPPGATGRRPCCYTGFGPFNIQPVVVVRGLKRLQAAALTNFVGCFLLALSYFFFLSCVR